MSYDHFEHRHRFAVWAAARAAQRGLTSVAVCRDALERSGVVEFIRDASAARTDAKSFDARHRRWCPAIVKRFERVGVRNGTYGRAAKLVAIYLKSMIVVGPDARSRLASVAHPPIDRLLLSGVRKAFPGHRSLARWDGIAWTRLDRRSYYQLVGDLRGLLAPDEPFWKLEEYWNVAG